MVDRVPETWMKGINILPGLAISLFRFGKPTVEERKDSVSVLHLAKAWPQLGKTG